ncbi:MAG: NAD-dependent epimerase/dehydratase family protein [Chloroflexi bacterium]|nr:NAD-dependent epimerase/dehydratase family protein [Chloroflexota bacterium]
MTEQPMRLLVVGGSGFIGRHIVERALELGWDVTSLSLRPGRESGHARVHHVSADISTGVVLTAALRSTVFEYVVNCGGYIDHASFSQGGRRVFDTHFQGVVNLAEILDRERLRAFVNIGSSDEYGGGSAPQIETHREAPISPYSLGKVAATHFLQTLYRTEGFPAVSLRLFLTYGPGQGTDRFMPQVIQGCLSGSSFPASEGRQLRDFCFVQDTVDAVFAGLATPAAHGEVVNIASGRGVSIRQVIEAIQRLTGGGDARFGEIAYRPGENMALYADVSKAKVMLGWEPRVALEAGLERTIQWIRDAS